MGEQGDHLREVCPYQGLAPFEAGRAELFFGRTRATRSLLERLGRRLTGHGSILLVSGASGVGKSSLLRAGLIPAVAKGELPVTGVPEWRCLLTTPTAQPLRALARGWAEAFGGHAETVAGRLRDDPRRALAEAVTEEPFRGRLLLVVDQFEELFTLVSDEHERQAFVATLHALAGGPHGAGVIIGVRADHWDRCAAYPQFAEAIQDGQAIVEPMSEADLRLAITGPAATAGLELEPGLVETILAELRAGDRYQAGALPLLSQALRNTWERRKDDTLTLRGYEESGRVRDSVRRTADEVLDRLGPEDRKAALRIFRRLTLITTGGQVARRRARLAEVHAAASAHSARRQEEIGALLSAFADRRLLTLHEDTVEIAHDALLTAWPTLRQWLEPDLAAQAVYDRLLEAAAQWADNHRDPAFLYRGARLLAVQDSRPRWERDPDGYPPPGPVVDGFVAASTREVRRASRRRRLAVAGLAMLSVLALIAAATAVNAADEADAQRKVALSRQLAAQSEVTGDVALASMLAVAAWDVARTDAARNRLLSAATGTGRGKLSGHTKGVMSLAFSGDGRIVATGSDDGTARLWDTASRRQLGAPITRAKYDCSSVELALSPDGRTLATACLDTVRFYDVATHRELGPELHHDEVVSALAYSPDGTTLVTGDFTGVVRQWDAAAHRPRGPALGRPDHGRELASIVRRVVFSRDGRSLAVARGKAVRLWDPATSRPLGAPVARQSEAVLDVAFSPDGTTLATVSFDNTARLWSLASGEPTGVIKDRNTGFNSIAFSPDGTRIATGGRTGRTVLWDTATRQQVVALQDNGMSVRRVAFGPDGRLLAAGGDDGLVRLADPQVHLQIGRPLPARDAVALSPDGRILATGAAEGKGSGVQLWDVATQRPAGPPLRSPDARGSVTKIAFMPDGRTLLTSAMDGLRLWDLASRRLIVHDALFDGLAELSPDGTFVAVQREQAIAFWDVASRREVGPRIRVPDHTDVITGMAISPDGRTLASAGFDSRVRLFDVATRRQLDGMPPASAGGLVNDLAFSPDGRTLAYTAADDAVRLWDVPHRRVTGVALIPEDDVPNALAFSPDGEVLATGLQSGDVLLWDLRVYRPLGIPMTGHARGVAGLVYDRGGTVVATVSRDGTARLWHAGTPADLVAAACANAGRALNREEWKILVPQEEYHPTCS
ncbi:NACHT and WD repeat domain-containing protein [Nonomuraea sp. CA-141351]|uniref:NACHT and WD repeat domain-containing protein n=1 Tax=Nonomuraea sp. CA-141351 TaxID=3239996 RepID=UPI003D90FB8D